MVGTYDILQGDKVVGKATVEKQGLYYRFSCRCRLNGTGIYRLAARWDGGKEDLGVCVPMDGQFGVEKKLPCKRFGKGTPEFRILSGQEKPEGKFVPIYPEEPFAYMSRLKHAFLVTQAGQLGIMIRE